jgi:transcriptional regulator with XRE-family HTH domain
MVAMSPTRAARAKEPKDPELVAIGRRLRELRVGQGMTQESLADAAGLHWTYIGQIERAERNFTVKNVLRLERGLGIGPGELLRTALDGVSQPSTG